MTISLNRASKRFPKAFWVIALAVVFVICLSQIPASSLASIVNSESSCRVVLHKPIGTIWNGSAAIGFSEPDGMRNSCRAPVALTERFTWKTQCSLMNGQCLVEMNFVSLNKPLITTFSLNQIKVAAGEISLPAAILEAFGNPWSTLRPRGQLMAQWSDIQKGSDTAGTVRLNVNNLSSPISAVKPLGSYQIKANLGQVGVPFVIDTTAGPLLLNGKGELGAKDGSGMHFLGSAHATPEAQDSLIGLLSLLGKKDGDIYRMQY
jgi:general secretion pathway protein N